MIEKYVFTAANTDEYRQELYKWLKQNAEGFVFDEVTLEENSIECSSGGAPMLSVFSYKNATNYMFIAKLKNGTAIWSPLSTQLNGISGIYAVKTSNGIFLHFEFGTRRVDVFVGVDKCLCGYGGGADTHAMSDVYFSAFFDDSAFQSYGQTAAKTANCTSFLPVCSNSNQPHSEIMFCTLFSLQPDITCTLAAEDEKYVYDGFFALKE